MKEVDAQSLLKELISVKEAELQPESELLKEYFLSTYESLKPTNIIKNTIRDVISAPDLKNSLVNAAFGLIAGVVAKKVFIGKSENPLKKLAGIILEMVVASKVSNYSNELKSFVAIILEKEKDKNVSEKT